MKQHLRFGGKREDMEIFILLKNPAFPTFFLYIKVEMNQSKTYTMNFVKIIKIYTAAYLFLKHLSLMITFLALEVISGDLNMNLTCRILSPFYPKSIQYILCKGVPLLGYN